MKLYYVSIPITGTATFEVKAENEKAAEEAAWEAVDEGEEPNLEWEYCRRIVSGNVFSGMQNEVSVDGGYDLDDEGEVIDQRLAKAKVRP